MAATAASRLKFMAIDADTKASLAEAWKVVQPRLGEMLDAFYAHSMTEPELAGHIKGKEPRLKSAQGGHWARLFSGAFDEAYFESANRIGMAHVRIGLEPRWYIAGYAFVMDRILEMIGEAHRFSGRRAARLARAVSKVAMLDMDLAISVYQEKILSDLANKSAGIEAAIAAFGGTFNAALATMSTASDRLTVTSSSLEGAAAATGERSAAMAETSSRTVAVISSSAAATEELVASMGEVGGQAHMSLDSARQAAEEVTRTNQTIVELATATERIGSVVEMITGIASQTNLLALNATIEAARAGDSGRGFAVVANEVKALAAQTSKATGEIAAQIAAVQNSTKAAVADMGRIRKTIDDVASIATSISAAVEQQRAATQEIANSAQRAATNSEEVGQSVAVVRDSNGVTASAATEVYSLAGELKTSLDDINRTVENFFRDVRAA